MKWRVVFTPGAERDARDALDYIAARSPLHAERWFARLRTAINRLQTLPTRCPRAPEAALFAEEIRQVVFGSYRILYVIRKRTVVIVHIRHGARRPATGDELVLPGD